MTRPPQTEQETLDGALIHAADFGDLADAIALMERGANPDGYPLIMAIQSPSADVVQAMLRFGANPNRPYSDTTPLIHAIRHAVRHADSEIVDLLLAAGADPNLPDSRGTLPMHALFATSADLADERVSAVRTALIEAGANRDK